MHYTIFCQIFIVIIVYSKLLSYEEMCINYRVDTYYRDVSIDDVCVRKRLAAKSLFWQMLTLWRGMKLAEGKYPEYLCLGLKVGHVALVNQMVEIGI